MEYKGGLDSNVEQPSTAKRYQDLSAVEGSKLLGYLIIGHGIGLTLCINLIFNGKLDFLVYTFFASAQLFCFGLFFAFLTNYGIAWFLSDYSKLIFKHQSSRQEWDKVKRRVAILELRADNLPNELLKATAIESSNLENLQSIHSIKSTNSMLKSELKELMSIVSDFEKEPQDLPNNASFNLRQSAFYAAVSTFLMLCACFNIIIVISIGPIVNFAPKQLDKFAIIEGDK